MRIVLIGKGRLATNLEPALAAAGHEVVMVNSRTLEGLPMEADAFIIAVKDSVLTEVIVAVTKGRESQVFMHTAGSMPMELFQGKAAHYGVFYPMQSFSKERQVDFSEIPTFIEASDEKAMTVIRRLAESVTGRVYELSSADRQYLHLAAVFACNFANHCYAMAADVLERHGMNFDVMLPLIDETARKVHQLHPLEAQTGPAVRYDENVIRHQMQLLEDSPVMKDLYERMSLHIHQKAKSE
jgi:predicted short-subunit dehydrogenase-like oxidoreductase (DUF2520 family)